MPEKFLHKKSLGQHFLNSDHVPKKMCAAAEVSTGDIVLEIGPGTGVLTQEILKRGARVVAVEADIRAIDTLEENFATEILTGQLAVHHMDARQLNFSALGLVDQQFKVVANIPYYISGLLFRQCLESTIQPTDLVFLVQKEVAERIARDPKESILSMSVKVFGNPKYIWTVKRGHFTPPPAVDSAVIAVREIGRENLILQQITSAVFFEILHLAFGNKRKQLLGNLAKDKRFTREQVKQILDDQNIPTDVRAEDLSIDQFLAIVSFLLPTTTT